VILQRRSFLALLGVAALPATTAAKRKPPPVVIRAGFRGGFRSGFATRTVRR
jgi:hypothetical protein